jgi:hypothetical protein
MPRPATITPAEARALQAAATPKKKRRSKPENSSTRPGTRTALRCPVVLRALEAVDEARPEVVTDAAAVRARLLGLLDQAERGEVTMSINVVWNRVKT